MSVKYLAILLSIMFLLFGLSAANYYECKDYTDKCERCYNKDSCQKCQYEYYAQDRVGCLKCDPNCANFLDVGSYGYACPRNGGCIRCKPGYYLTGQNKCTKCIDNCATGNCYDWTGCTKCVDGYYIGPQNKCNRCPYCPKGKCYDWTGACVN